MTVTNSASETNVAEVADGVFRINTPVEFPGGVGAFNFNQYLVVDEQPLAALAPTTLACMHGSAWRGDGKRALLDLADCVAPRG